MWFLELNFHLCLSRFMYPLKVSRSIPATGRFKWQQWSRILHFYVSNDYLNRLANYFNSNLNMPYHIFSWESLIEIITTASLLVNPQHFLFLLIFKWDGNFLTKYVSLLITFIAWHVPWNVCDYANYSNVNESFKQQLQECEKNRWDAVTNG